MADLTSKEWRDLIFEGKNKDFGAYQLRKNSDKRHNLAVLWTLIGLVVIALAVWAWTGYSAYRARIEAEEALAAEKMQAAQFEAEDQEEEEQEEQNTKRKRSLRCPRRK